MIDLGTLAVLSGTMPDNLKNEAVAWVADNKNSLSKVGNHGNDETATARGH